MPVTAEDYKVVNGTYYRKDVDDKLVEMLEACREKRVPLQLHYGDLDTGEDYLEESDIRGKIGRSMGPIKVPLLIEKGQDGGPELFSHIVLVTHALGPVLWKHPKYHLPKIQQKACIDPLLTEQGYKHEVLVKGIIHARFKSLWSLDAYLKRIAGPKAFLRKLPGGILELEREKD